MKHLKLYEDHNNFYTQTGEFEYEDLISQNSLYCFSDTEIKILKSKKCDIMDAKLYNLEGFFYLNRTREELDFISYEYAEKIGGNEVNKITIHHTNNSESVVKIGDLDRSRYVDIHKKAGDYKIVENYTAVHITKDDYLIAVNKLADEWYVIVEMSPDADWKFYKCDQIEGVINFLSKKEFV